MTRTDKRIGNGSCGRRVLTAALALVMGSWTGLDANAQSGPVLLQVKPNAGDTIRLRLDQTVEMTGPTGTDGRSQVESGTLVLLATLAVESVDHEGATIVSSTDSVRVNSPPNSASSAVLAWAALAANRAARFRVAPNGSAWVPTGRGRAVPSTALATQMPATLPTRPISRGATWTSSMAVPLASSADPKGTATLVAQFTFDSLSRSGELAFISLRGRLMKSEAESTEPKNGQSVVETSGTVIGSVILDRRRGWITDARTTFSLYSLVTPANPAQQPVRVRMTISQWMRAM